MQYLSDIKAKCDVIGVAGTDDIGSDSLHVEWVVANLSILQNCD